MKVHGMCLDPARTADGKLLNQDRIYKRLRFLASKMEAYYGPYNGDLRTVPLAVGVLMGAAFIYPMLLQRFSPEFPVLVGYIRAKSYKGQKRGPVKISDPVLDADIRDRKILIVDDIVESGHTLQALTEWFRERGAADVRTFALLQKPQMRSVPIEVDWVGFAIDSSQWVVGLGLDANNLFRNFPNIVVPRLPRDPK